MDQNNSNVDSFTEIETTTVYHKLASLCTEMEDAIRSLNDSSLTIQNDILRMRSEAFKVSCPEAEYAAQLFRRYTKEIARKIEDEAASADESKKKSDEALNFTSIVGHIPSFIYQGDAEHITKETVQKKNIFYYRVLVFMFSIISFAVMSSVNHINNKQVKPHSLFNDKCDANDADMFQQGLFNFVPYQYVISLTILAMVYSFMVCGYYVLPVNSSGIKYIPGLTELLVKYFDPSKVIAYSTSISTYLKLNCKAMESLGDGFFLIVCNISFIVAAVALNWAHKFSDGGGDLDVYFSLHTFVVTYSNTDPACITDNPVGKIRAALFILFLMNVALALAFQVSLRSYFIAQLENNSTELKINYHRGSIITTSTDTKDPYSDARELMDSSGKSSDGGRSMDV